MSLGAATNLLLRQFGRKSLSSVTTLRYLSPPSPAAALGPLVNVNDNGKTWSAWGSWLQASSLHSLTDTRFPKRRPGLVNRRKRASLRPPGPYAWIQYVPGEPIPRSRPNEGSVQGRNRIKRIKQRKAFIKAEAKKRKAELQEAKRKKKMKSIERKMAAVARERAWAERLIELQKLEEEKANKTMA